MGRRVRCSPSHGTRSVRGHGFALLVRKQAGGLFRREIAQPWSKQWAGVNQWISDDPGEAHPLSMYKGLVAGQLMAPARRRCCVRGSRLKNRSPVPVCWPGLVLLARAAATVDGIPCAGKRETSSKSFETSERVWERAVSTQIAQSVFDTRIRSPGR